MRHDYNYFTKGELLGSPKIPIVVMEKQEDVFRALAREMTEEIKRKNALKERTVLICPVGPVGQYPYFVQQVNEEKISLKNVYFFNMDEYLGEDGKRIDINHRLSFRGFMQKNVYDKLDPELVMPPSQRIFPDPGDVKFVPEEMERLGGADICFGGIGLNGHVAFNEAKPGMSGEVFLQLKTRVEEVSRETRVTNCIMDLNGALEDMPRLCVTIGFFEIFGARKIRLACFRDWHRGVVRRAAYGEASSAFPVSLLQEHADACILIPELVANLP